MSTVAIPHRQFTRPLRAIGQAILGEDIEPLVRDIARRIRAIRNLTQAGTYVLADGEGNVYVLQEIAPTTEKVVRREVAWRVGLYANEPRNPLFPDVERLRLDLLTTFFRVGFLKHGMIYGEAQHSDH
jgi:hypothetical protein